MGMADRCRGEEDLKTRRERKNALAVDGRQESHRLADIGQRQRNPQGDGDQPQAATELFPVENDSQAMRKIGNHA